MATPAEPPLRVTFVTGNKKKLEARQPPVEALCASLCG
jgi:hypothetical protein